MNQGRTTAISGGTGTTSTPANNVGGGGAKGEQQSGDRRQSQSGLFSGLMNQKRNSQDATAQARRESFNDMKPAPGMIGQMWNNFTKGTGGSPPK